MESQKEFTITISRDDLNLLEKSLSASAHHFASRVASLRLKGLAGVRTLAATGARYRRLLDRILAEIKDAPDTDACDEEQQPDDDQVARARVRAK
jgi:hypothetical protein